MHKRLTFEERLRRYPPCLCRLLAKKPWGPPLSSADIANGSGGPLTAAAVDDLARRTSWGDVPLGQMNAFLAGCGIDLEDRRCFDRIERLLRGTVRKGRRCPPSLLYLRRHPEWKSYYLPLLRISPLFAVYKQFVQQLNAGQKE